MNNNENSIKTLQDLVDTCQEGRKGYQDASEHLQHPDLKTILYRLSQQRALFEAELKDEIRQLGGDEEETGSLKGAIHRVWMDFKSGFNGNDTNAILNECKKEENDAMRTYEEALKAELPHYIHEKVEEQYKLIKGAYAQLVEFQGNPS